MVACAPSIALIGLDGHAIDVEVQIGQGLPAFTIVGLPDPSISEARERVRAAIESCGEKWPQHRITVNLSPAHLRKTGSSFDLAMALGVLAEVGRVPRERLAEVTSLGELSLDGRVRSIPGVLPAALSARERGARAVLVPAANAGEAALVPGLHVVAVAHLRDAVGFLRTGRGGSAPEAVSDQGSVSTPDLADVRGNGEAKLALEIAAAGGHNLVMVGPPGGGKTMLARRLPGLLPPLSDEEAFEVTRIHSVAGLLGDRAGLVRQRPFRAPHHAASTTGIVGGGSTVPHPGEVSLAHRGVLFLDEMAEFRREVLQALRQPLEDGIVTIVRSRFAVTYPARAQLVAAANPCPCGFVHDDLRSCSCGDARVAAYKARLRGPVMDRVDLQVDVPRLHRGELFAAAPGEPSEAVALRVARVRDLCRERSGPEGPKTNAEIPARGIETACRADRAALAMVEAAIEQEALSARGAHRVLRVARTIADLAGADSITRTHVIDAVHFRVGVDRA